MITRLQYWILVSGEAWMDVDLEEVARLRRQGFEPVLKITAARS